MPILHWLNKEEAITTAKKCDYRLLEEVPTLSYGHKDNENLLIQGDNLEALKALLPFYGGRVKCIFIDPPYNTGNAFDHYDDNLEHSIWLNLIYPRLELLWELLSEDGYIAIQIDDNELAHLYLIASEIFGANTLKLITLKMSEASGLKMASVKNNNSIPKLKEHILLARKSSHKGFYIDSVAKEKWDSEYNIFLENFTPEDKELISTVSNKKSVSKEDLKTLDDMILKVEMRSVADVIKELGLKGKDKEAWLFKNAYRICQCAASKSALTLANEKKQQNKNNLFFVETEKGLIYLVRSHYSESSKQPRIQMIFAEDNLKVHPGDLWTDIKTTGLKKEGVVDFKNGKKPEKLVQRIIEMATIKGDMVLDSFLGSGTTAAVAHKMGRRYIGIEIGEHARTHCQKRLKEVVDGEQSGISKAVKWIGGGGFRFCKLGAKVFDEYGSLNSEIRFPALAGHIWYLETKFPLNEKQINTLNSPFLGEHKGIAYYLLYNGILGDRRPHGGNVLTSKVLDSLPNIEKYIVKSQHGESSIVIYGESSRLGDTRLQQAGVQFKQIPYDVGIL